MNFVCAMCLKYHRDRGTSTLLNEMMDLRVTGERCVPPIVRLMGSLPATDPGPCWLRAARKGYNINDITVLRNPAVPAGSFTPNLP
jgi:hypothetical protein